MNIYEIFVLNRALDGKDIFALPSFAELNISNFMIDDIKNALIEKGILESESTFTDEGVRQTNRLRLFKQADKHIQIGNVVMGVLDKNESILLLYNPLSCEYKIEIMDSSDMAGQLVSFYSFLTPERTVETVHEEKNKMSKREFSDIYALDESNHFRMLIEEKGKKRDEVYFSSGGKYYVYDTTNGVLSSRSYKGLINQLEERMRME